MSLPSRLHGWLRDHGTARPRPGHAIAIDPRRLEEGVKQLAVSGYQQYASVVAEDALVFLQLLQEGVKLRIPGVGLVADGVGLGVALAFELPLLRQCIGLDCLYPGQ